MGYVLKHRGVGSPAFNQVPQAPDCPMTLLLLGINLEPAAMSEGQGASHGSGLSRIYAPETTNTVPGKLAT